MMQQLLEEGLLLVIAECGCVPVWSCPQGSPMLAIAERTNRRQEKTNDLPARRFGLRSGAANYAAR